MCAIGNEIARYRWSQASAEETVGLTQLRVADLLTGKINRSTFDDLIAIGLTVGVRAEVK